MNLRDPTMNLRDRPDLQPAARLFRLAAKASASHADLFGHALETFGNGDGATVSGIGRGHFPDECKDALRSLARLVVTANEMGRRCRPRGVRRETMNRLARIECSKHGTGFYGYQPRA